MPMATSIPIGGGRRAAPTPTGSFQINGASPAASPLAGALSSAAPAQTNGPAKRWADYTPSAAVALDGGMLWPSTPTPMSIAETSARGLNFSSIMTASESMSVAEYNAKLNRSGIAELPEEGGTPGAVVGSPVVINQIAQPLKAAAAPVTAQAFGQQVLFAALAAPSLESTPSRTEAAKVHIKNTFIDGFSSDEEDLGIATHQLGAKSMPMSMFRAAAPAISSTTIQAATAAVANQAVGFSQPSGYSQQPIVTTQTMVAAPQVQTMVRTMHISSQMLAPSSPGHHPVMGQYQPAAGVTVVQQPIATSPISQQPASAGSKVVAPYELRQPEPSIGSKEHGTGQCRPCAWFWKPQGCANASDCRHCHMCPEGELKNRKKDKVATMRNQPGRQ